MLQDLGRYQTSRGSVASAPWDECCRACASAHAWYRIRTEAGCAETLGRMRGGIMWRWRCRYPGIRKRCRMRHLAHMSDHALTPDRICILARKKAQRRKVMVDWHDGRLACNAEACAASHPASLWDFRRAAVPTPTKMSQPGHAPNAANRAGMRGHTGKLDT